MRMFQRRPWVGRKPVHAERRPVWLVGGTCDLNHLARELIQCAMNSANCGVLASSTGFLLPLKERCKAVPGAHERLQALRRRALVRRLRIQMAAEHGLP